MQIDFIYSVCLNKIMTPLLDQPEKQRASSINFKFFHDRPPTFLPTPLEINNDRSLISIITYQNVVVKINNNSNIIITIIIYNKTCWGDID